MGSPATEMKTRYKEHQGNHKQNLKDLTESPTNRTITRKKHQI